jgi:alpha-beta hydrolase superfamily lysophospholipase
VLRGVVALLVVAGSLAGAVAAGAGSRALPPLEQRCGSAFAGVSADMIRFRAGDGTRLDGARLGDGAVGVVLASESQSDLCGWVPYAITLQKAGFRVLDFDYRGFGYSARGPSSDYASDVVGAALELRREGAAQVFLVGASLGGAAAFVAGTRLPWVAGVASLSGEIDFSGTPLHPLRLAPTLRVPLLVMTSTTDRYLTISDSRRLIRATGSKQKRLVIYPGAWHGWDLLYDAPFKARASATLIGFLRAHAHRP